MCITISLSRRDKHKVSLVSQCTAWTLLTCWNGWIQHPSLPGEVGDWGRQADVSDVWVETLEVHLNDRISDDVSSSLRLRHKTHGIPHVTGVFLQRGKNNKVHYCYGHLVLCWSVFYTEEVCAQLKLQSYHWWLASTGYIISLQYFGHVEGHTMDDLFLSNAGLVGQVEGLQWCIVILEEIFNGSDGHEVLRTCDLNKCICLKKDKVSS